jgi:3-isopropylmalate/(R)-2-methylmalate dehydratase large subunit
MGQTLATKVWESHVVRSADGEPDLLHVDLHLLHELNTVDPEPVGGGAR